MFCGVLLCDVESNYKDCFTEFALSRVEGFA